MPLIWKRRIKATVAGLEVEDLRMNMSMTRSVDPTQDKGTLDIFNLNPEHESRILERGRELKLEAGYSETLAIVFQGSVQQATAARVGLARRVRIKLGDHVQRKNVTGAIFSGSYGGAQPVREIARDIVAAMSTPEMELALGPLDNIPADATVTDFYWGAQSAAAALSALLKAVNCTWYEADGLVRINRVGRLQSDMPTLRISQETGLIGSPTRTDEGAECRMFLNPAVQVGACLVLESESLQGDWKIVGLEHNADNWQSSKFETFCELRDLAA